MRLALYTGIILAGGYTCLTPALAADPTGDWRVADGVANIRVAQCNGSMWGAVSWEKQPGGRDENNPDVSKKNRPTLGMATLIDMKKKPGVDQWEGQVYNAKDGQLYSATITPAGTDQLEIKGCVMGFLCGGETWTRVGPPIPLSTANAMAKGGPKSTAPKAQSTTGAAAPAAPAPAAPKTAAKPGQKGAADTVGDICLLPEIAGLAH
ncbi:MULTISPECIES: DUF2147 domain-containing protein [unclassified Bradyrhizobium]|uniref:DUF2147 domain-containing protein n=1 Tax=unclassified Bradyrhizobium TaxID=2631580 RepID=UPI0024B18611|nr:DUF2147 domain-containing protein [Bradyrhizobium sp. CB2312]WFU70253.1 DUF2147 domain-containing protein [Bradyrhizobium sp. CB2312]